MREITYSKSEKCNTGNYEQSAPMVAIKSIVEDGVDVQEELRELKEIVNAAVKVEVTNIKGGAEHLRFRVKDGKQYPSVTTILTPNKLDIDPEYGDKGTEYHDMFYDYISTGKVRPPSFELKKLKWDIDLDAYLTAYEKRINFTLESIPLDIYNETHMYSGELDLICEIDGLRTLCDIKSGSYFKFEQLVAYNRALENPCEQLAFFALKKGNLITLNAKDDTKYWENFLIARGRFIERFGK